MVPMCKADPRKAYRPVLSHTTRLKHTPYCRPHFTFLILLKVVFTSDPPGHILAATQSDTALLRYHLILHAALPTPYLVHQITMSSSIAIPKRKQSQRHSANLSISSTATPGSSTSPGLNSYQSPSSAVSSYGMSPSSLESRRFGKSKAIDTPTQEKRPHERRLSLLGRSDTLDSDVATDRLPGSSLSKSEYTVINLGHSDGPQRLVSFPSSSLLSVLTLDEVTCVKSSQGFDWNQGEHL